MGGSNHPPLIPAVISKNDHNVKVCLMGNWAYAKNKFPLQTMFLDGCKMSTVALETTDHLDDPSLRCHCCRTFAHLCACEKLVQSL